MFAGFIENFFIFLIGKCKLDDNFPDKQFRRKGLRFSYVTVAHREVV